MKSSVVFLFVIIVIVLSSCIKVKANPAAMEGERIEGNRAYEVTAVGEYAASPEPENIRPTAENVPSAEAPSEPEEDVSAVKPIETKLPPDQEIPLITKKATRALTSNAWKGLPVIPDVSDNVKTIYQRGLELNNNPNAYSKIGDCGSTPTWFLGDFDRGPKYYDLGEYTYLYEVIQEFRGSHERTSMGARAGFNAPSLFVPLWSDIKNCRSDEGPLECEYRIHRPIVGFIMLGTNDIWHPDEFEPSMRKIIEYSINHGVIPILSTKADNQEGDGSINYTIAKLALEYDVPLINYWRAVQNLPDKGLQEDGVHLTWGSNDFSDPDNLNAAWPIRNLTALQTLDKVWRTATSQ